MAEYSKFDTLNISPKDIISDAEYTWVESDWSVHADGTTKTAYRLNRKTGERQPYSYLMAMKALSGDK
jgi:hypothetical protein